MLQICKCGHFHVLVTCAVLLLLFAPAPVHSIFSFKRGDPRDPSTKTNTNSDAHARALLQRLQRVARHTYDTVFPCLKGSADQSSSRFALPNDAFAHYEQLMQVTAQFRGLAPHKKDPYDDMESSALDVSNRNTSSSSRHRQGHRQGPRWGSGSSGWDAKWIENHFVAAFAAKPLPVSSECVCLLCVLCVLVCGMCAAIPCPQFPAY